MPRPWTSKRSPRAEWTIEASVRPARLHCGCQTFVVRDGHEHIASGELVPVPPRLAFQITAEGRFAIRYRDV